MSKKEWNNEFKKDRGWLKRLESRLKAVEDTFTAIMEADIRNVTDKTCFGIYRRWLDEHSLSPDKPEKTKYPEKNRCDKCGGILYRTYESGEIACPACLIGETSAVTSFMRGKSDRPECKSSAEWAEIFKTKFKILDPDGWNRTGNFTESWMELITEKEFNRRVSISTIEGFYSVKPESECKTNLGGIVEEAFAEEAFKRLSKKPERKHICTKCGRTSGMVTFNPCPFCDPVPPLNVRVAKALEMTIAPCKNHPGDWLFMTGAVGAGAWQSIPPYDSDLTAAMGALEEYCRKQVEDIDIFNQTEIPIWRVQLGRFLCVNKSLPTAICEAIVKHSQGK